MKLLLSKNYISLALVLAGYTLMLIMFTQYSQNGYTFASRILAWLLFIFGTVPMLIYFAKKKAGFPLLELVLLAYVNAFSLPLFFQSSQRLWVKTLYPQLEPVSICLMLAILAMVTLWVGFSLARLLLPKWGIPRVALQCNDQRLYTLALFFCIASVVFGGGILVVSMAY